MSSWYLVSQGKTRPSSFVSLGPALVGCAPGRLTTTTTITTIITITATVTAAITTTNT